MISSGRVEHAPACDYLELRNVKNQSMYVRKADRLPMTLDTGHQFAVNIKALNRMVVE